MKETREYNWGLPCCSLHRLLVRRDAGWCPPSLQLSSSFPCNCRSWKLETPRRAEVDKDLPQVLLRFT